MSIKNMKYLISKNQYINIKTNYNITCAASDKGFGKKSSSEIQKNEKLKKSKTKKIKINKKKAIEKALNIDNKEKRNVRPIDPEEAAKGRLDFATVKSWGTGEPKDLGNLKVDDFVESAEINPNIPFYTQLAKNLELLEKKGNLDLSARNFPPFERWIFKFEHYLHYLQNQICIHRALDESLSGAIKHNSNDNKYIKYLKKMSNDNKLDRSEKLIEDFENLKEYEKELSSNINPTPEAIAYSNYIKQLYMNIKNAENEKTYEINTFKLFSNAYTIKITHLTTGTRIGAVAAEKFNLFSKNAINAYHSYDNSIIKDPIKILIQIINESGQEMSIREKEIIFEEQSNALKKTALLLIPLAKES